MRTFAMIAAVGMSQAALAGSTIGLNFCDRYNDPRVSDGVCDGFSGWTDSRAAGDTTNAAVQSTPLALGTSGVTATWTASNSWAGGSQTNNEVALYRVYLDDGQTSTGIGVRVTIAGLAGWMSANGCSSYQIRCYASTDYAASFRPISIRSGSLTTSPVVHTMTPAILGGSDFPTNLTMPTLPAVARGYVDSPDTLTDDTITLTIPNRSGTSRGTLCAFKITGTVGSIAGGAALFANPTYVDTTGEMQVTRTALLNLGLPVRTFTGITATDWNNAFAADFVVIPELEKLGLTLTSDAIAAINQNLAAGKGLIVTGSGNAYEETLLNTLRGGSLTHFGYATTGTTMTKRAGVPFPNSPATLPVRDATYMVTTSSLPPGTEPIFQSGAGTAVFVRGPVGYLGYDGYGGVDSDWTNVLSDLIEAVMNPPRGPEIAVEQPVGTELEDGLTTANFGYTPLSSPAQMTFTVRNHGNEDLSALVATTDGPHAADFSVTSAPASLVAPTGATTFTVRFSPAAAGVRTATLRLASNDESENPYDIALSGFGYIASINPDFQILTLGSTGSAVVEHDGLTADDCGGIAISGAKVFVTGDGATAGFGLNLTGGVSLGRRVVGLCSDLGTGAVFAMANNGVEITSGGGTFNQLIGLDPVTGAVTSSVIPLSSPIPLTGSSGVFSGNGRVIIHNGTNVYDILIPSGVVSDLGAMTRPNWYGSETWAAWGVAESFGGQLYLAYRKSGAQTIVRSRIPDGVTETIATFTNLGDMASWTVSPANNRWYFHHEGSSQFGGNSETLGYADATFAMGPPTEPPAILSPLTATGYVGAAFSYRIVGSKSPTGFAATGLPANLTVNPTTGVISGTPAAIGNYPITISVSNVVGTTEATLDLTVSATATALFDDFDPGIDGSQWSAFGGTVTANTYGQAAGAGSTGNSLHFDGVGSRHATTAPIDTRSMTAVGFRFALAGGTSSTWESADSGKEVVVEYSLDGITFVLIGTLSSDRAWHQVVLEIPVAARTAATWFRWRQLANSGLGYDHWALEDVRIDSSVVPIPKIEVEQPGGTKLTDGAAIAAFGSTLVGGNTDLTFTIRNSGSANLTGLAVTLDGANAADFSITTQPTGTVAIGGFSTAFTVRFTPSAIGARSAVLHIASNDADENPFDVALTGVGMDASGAVSLFANASYVDTSVNGEVNYTRASLQNLGYAVNLFTGITEADWNSAFSATWVVIPELEVGSLALTANAISAINQHLAAGKGLIVMGANSSSDEALLNALRGWSLVNQGSISSGSMAKLSGVSGFENSAESLTALNATYLVSSASLPSGATPIYQSGIGTAVFLQGPVVYLGYDWFAGADPAWTTVLGDALVALGPPPNGPEIGVEQPTGSSLRAGQSQVTFGHAVVGQSSAPLTFTVRNLGTEPLSGVAVEMDGVDAADFTVVTEPGDTVPPAGATTLVVRFTPSASGTRQAVLHIASNDASEDPFDVMLTGFGYSSAVNPDFKILTLGSTGAAVVDHNGLTGDDRGGIAVSASQVFVTGASTTARYGLDLTAGIPVGRLATGICGDFGSGAIFALAKDGVEIPASGGTVNQLITLDPTTGALTANVIPLSMPITLPSGSGVFSGNGRIVLHNGTAAFDLLVPSGVVTPLGAMAKPLWYASNTWAVWGVAESFDGRLHLAYRASSSHQIQRSRVPDGAVEVIATFSNLADLANWTVSPANSRWYFHHESSSQFGGTTETLGYADATFAIGQPTERPVISSPLTATGYAGAAFTYRTYANHSPTGYAASGLPSGLVMNPTNGVISGTVTSVGRFPVTLAVTNAVGTTTVELVLSVMAAPTAVFDDFDPAIHAAMWSAMGGTVTANTVGQAAGAGSVENSLHFDGNGMRHATTVPIDARGMTALSFDFALANGTGATWENAETGEEVVLEYALDGVTFVQFGGPYSYRAWQRLVVDIPIAARTGAVWFRWRQLGHSGAANDHWALDNVRIDSSVFTAPEIAVEYPVGTGLTDGAGSVDFGANTTGYSKSLTFTIRNTGSAPLTGLAITFDGENSGDFNVTTAPTTTVAIGGNTTFVVRHTPTAVGLRTATLRLASNDADENPFDIALTGIGQPASPEIAVEQPAGSGLVDGNSLANFSSVAVGGSSTLTFTVRNTGASSLTSLGITMDGTNAADFSVTTAPVVPVAVGGTATFVVRFMPSAAGARTATLHLANDDFDEGIFDIGLRGVAGTSVVQTLNTTYRGWYESGGIHTVGNDNYITGWWVDSASKEYRSFFIFDVPALAAGESIVAAELRVLNPSNGFNSADPEETLRVAAVTTPPATLSAGTGGVAAFADLGDGTVFNKPVQVSTASNGATLVIPLNAAFLAQINSLSGAPLALGASVSSLRGVPGSQEHLFAFSSGAGTAISLVLTKMSNTKPTFSGFAASTPWQTPAPISITKLLTKAGDADGDAVSLVSVGNSTNGGTTSMQAGAVLYTPPANFSGTDTFPVTIQDARGAVVVGTVTMAVGSAPNAGGAGTNPPVLTAQPGGGMQLGFHGIPGRSYVVQRSVGGLNDWVTLGTVTADASGRVSITDPSPPVGSAFYRLGLP